MILMNFDIMRFTKIDKRFFRWRQAEMDELVQDFLYDLAEDNDCEYIDLPGVYGFNALNDMLMRFNHEVQKIWIEAEKQGE